MFSTGVAFTLQAIGQQYVPPANAAIILSAESLFAALGGALILGERLPPLGYVGAAIIFAPSSWSKPSRRCAAAARRLLRRDQVEVLADHHIGAARMTKLSPGFSVSVPLTV